MNTLSIPLTIGVTAHRDLLETEIPGIERAIGSFFNDLKTRYPGVPLRLLSPLAEGGGRIAARVALELGIELIVPLPFAAREYERDFSGSDSVDEFRALCDQGEVLEIPGTGEWDLEAIASGGQARDMQYANLGVFLADQAQVLLAIWDGKTLPLPGGTSQVINYHQFGHMAGTGDRFDRGQSILAEDDTDLVFHIVCSRDRENGQPAEDLSPLDTR